MIVTLCVFFFLCSSLFWIYIFIEIALAPMLVVLLAYGSQVQKIGASYFFIFYSFFCRFFFLYSFFFFCSDLFFIGFSDLIYLNPCILLFLSLFLLIKFPLYFLHLWLPKVHVESPTAASVLLARLLLKLGTFGFCRLWSDNYNLVVVFYFFTFSFLGMLCCSFVCCFLSDIKLVVAYSSIVHISFLFLILIISSIDGKWGSVCLILAHGYISALIFYLVGVLYSFFKTRVIYLGGGLWVFSLILRGWVIVLFLFNSGVPFSISFYSELFGLSASYYKCWSFVFFLFFYYFISFYYSLYFFLSLLVGKNNFVFFFDFTLWMFFLLVGSINFFYFF